jgi:hypothetical protein
MALTIVACIVCALAAFSNSLTLSARVQRDTISNTEISASYLRLQRIISTQWSCTASLQGANYLQDLALLDPVAPSTVLAQDGISSGPFWHFDSVKMINVQAVAGRPGILSGDLEIRYAKSMSQQTGSPFVTRTIPGVVFDADSNGAIHQCYPSPTSQAQASAACQVLGGTWTAANTYGSQCVVSHGNNNSNGNGNGSSSGGVQAAGIAPSPGICSDTNAGIIALPNSHVAINGNGTVQTAIYMMNGSDMTLSGNANVQGTVFEGTSTTVSKDKKATLNQVTSGDLSSLSQTITAFAAAETALPSNSQLASISSSMTLTGSGGMNVIQVTGDINLTGGSTLTLSGSTTDIFVINVLGKITVAGNGAILVTGGVPAKNVIFNNIGTGNEIVLSGNGAVAGTFLATQRGAQVSGNGQMQGAIIAGGGLNTKLTVTGNGIALLPSPFCLY